VQRRQFIVLLGGAAAASLVSWPPAARAQQATMPVIGFLRSSSINDAPHLMTAFRQGLKERGFVEGQNVAVEYYAAENDRDLLRRMAAELIRRPVAIIVANQVSALVAKASTTTVPVVFATGSDPVRDGLVAALNRPGGNVTGVVFFGAVVGAKRLELLRQLVPTATPIAVLVGLESPETVAERGNIGEAAQSVGLPLVFFDVASERDIETAFAKLRPSGGSCRDHDRRRVHFLPSGADCHAGGSSRLANVFCQSRTCRGGRSDELRSQHYRCLPPSRHLRRTDSQRRETG
jgi:putative tryptophan/tyrosine transport system substrate-binding protein